jgi:predicted DNA-binding transcriptional regulator AlpA
MPNSFAARQHEPEEVKGALAQPLGPRPAQLLVDIQGLSGLLSRSRASLFRDDAAGRLPAGVRLGNSKRWRYDEIAEWVRRGCPCRRVWAVIWEQLSRSRT